MFKEIDKDIDKVNLLFQKDSGGYTGFDYSRYNFHINSIHDKYEKVAKKVGYYYVCDRKKDKTIFYNLVPHTNINVAALINYFSYLEDYNIVFLDNSGIYYYQNDVHYEELIQQQIQDTMDIFQECNLDKTRRMLSVPCAGAPYWVDIASRERDLFDVCLFIAPMLHIKENNTSILLEEFMKDMTHYIGEEMGGEYLYWSWGRMITNRNFFPPKYWIIKNIALLKEFFYKTRTDYFHDLLKNIKNKHLIVSKEDGFITYKNSCIDLFDADKVIEVPGAHLAYKRDYERRDEYFDIIKKLL